jgi:glutamyl-tRNA reductase
VWIVSLILVGLNYQTAPVELREQFFLADGARRVALERLHAGGLSEVVIVSTCNRLEIYGAAEQPEIGYDEVVIFLAASQHIPAEPLRSRLYFCEGQSAVGHLMRVTCGLESLILGETQILGQVSRALAQAQEAGTVGAILSHLFNAAVHAGKRARTETAISRHTLSVSHAAVLLVKQQLGDLTPLRALVIGAGEMAELAVRALQRQGASSINVMSRTFASAADLARRYGLLARDWSELAESLRQYDVVITATSAHYPIIRVENIAPLDHEERRQPILLMDIGVPRNVSEEVRALPGVRMYNIDDLRAVVETHRHRRQKETNMVESIIDQEQDAYSRWLSSREVVPLIVALRHHAEMLAQAEVAQALHRLPELTPREQEIVAQMAHRIVNKLLHAPTASLKAGAARGCRSDYADTARRLFTLHGGAEQMNNP